MFPLRRCKSPCFELLACVPKFEDYFQDFSVESTLAYLTLLVTGLAFELGYIPYLVPQLPSRRLQPGAIYNNIYHWLSCTTCTSIILGEALLQAILRATSDQFAVELGGMFDDV